MAKNIAPVPSEGAVPAPSLKVVNTSGAPSDHTTLVARKNAQAADPANMPIGIRTYAPKERNGASYGTRVKFQAHTNPEAGFTQGNGRIFKPAVNRSAPNFAAGMNNSN